MNIVIIDCFDTWEHRVDLLCKVLKSEGHRVTCLLSDFRHIKKRRRYDIKENFKFFTAEPYEKNISIYRIHSHMQLSLDIFGWVEEMSEFIDILWVLVPPNSFVRDAARVKIAHPHIRLIIDIIDLWPETMPMGKLKCALPFHVWQGLRNKYLKYADCIVTECNLYQKVIGSVIEGIETHTLYLAREDRGYKPDLHLADEQVSLCYLGSVNNIIDIDAIGEVIKNCRKEKPVKLIIVGDGEKKHELIKIAKESGAEVDYKGTVYNRMEKQKIFDSCHYGLNIMKRSVCVGLTMKSIDYFEFGLPIINNIRGDTWDVIEKYECGINMDGAGFGSKIRMLNTEIYLKQRQRCRNFFEIDLTEDVFRETVLSIVAT